MNINEIKKELYKQRPNASMVNITKSGILYIASIEMNDGDITRYKVINFIVPLSEIGDAIFKYTMDAKLLIRYIVTPETENK